VYGTFWTCFADVVFVTCFTTRFNNYIQSLYSGLVASTLDAVPSSAANHEQESPANAKGTRDSSACMRDHCEQM